MTRARGIITTSFLDDRSGHDPTFYASPDPMGCRTLAMVIHHLNEKTWVPLDKVEHWLWRRVMGEDPEPDDELGIGMLKHYEPSPELLEHCRSASRWAEGWLVWSSPASLELYPNLPPDYASLIYVPMAHKLVRAFARQGGAKP